MSRQGAGDVPGTVPAPSLDAGGHWRKVARGFHLLGSPLRPCAEDIHIIEALLAAEPGIFPAGGKRRAWLLGVTPEIASLSWPRNVDLVAVERVQAMIDEIWPGDTDNRRAVRADWMKAPFPDGSVDLAIGDGCLTAVSFPGEFLRLLASIRRCLRPEGHLLLRLFCRPDVVESPEAVIAALESGASGSFHAFKWRLAMALQGRDEALDVTVDAVWSAWNAARVDVRALAARRGWPEEVCHTIDLYRGSPARYTFMRYADAVHQLGCAGFDLVATRRGSYELADCCPHVLLRRRPDVA